MKTRSLAIAAAFALTCALAASTVQPAWAVSPHFVSASASITNAGNLTVNFQESGLGNFSTVFIQASADESDTWGCLNHGNNHPQGLDTNTAPVTSPSTQFTVGHNGTVKGSVTITHQASPPPTFSCPAANMTVVLVAVSYTDVTVTDSTSGQSINVSGTFTKTFFK
jgi:hypothetical protein